ncbi:Acetyl-CoA acetyltransferase [Blastococcus aggregatus]|uniref:propanoyl-CoA C-acyltransferase n=1 Tax=Blastococcus aggregatus TaxID=38502 RepID=A0A285V389_9ACTN|nr:thiolase family protein [Blastococcus aggregatus]SOC48562.1 Acetyl-CoA acetyltransferase [Blastococcus aggregatus]
MSDVALIGTGITRFGKALTIPLRALVEEAVTGALADAGVDAGDLQAAFCGNAIAGLITGQEMVRGQVALRSMGIQGIPVVNVENACATASTALHLACTAVASGQYDLVLVVGAEKMTHEDRRRPVLAVASALDVEADVDLDSPSPFMDVYAAKVREYLAHSEATVEDLARVVVKAQRLGALNPKAQYGGEVTVEQVLADPVISDPLTRSMCSPIGDGAAAVVVASVERAKALGIPQPVQVLASVLQSGSAPGSRDPAGVRSARLAYEHAGLGPEDLDVVELHDAAASSELTRYESLQLCGAGEGARLIRDGTTDLGGMLPVNTGGGLLARGHPIGATGSAQVVELCDQLRGRSGARQVAGARIALADNGGGWVGGDSAAECVHILAT